MSFGAWVQDESEFALERDLEDALFTDDVESFIRMIEHPYFTRPSSLVRGQEYLMKVCMYMAFKCATVLVRGDTPLIFDVNRPTARGLYPLHHAAGRGYAGIVELLIYHGARTDLCCEYVVRGSKPCVPLHAALYSTSSLIESRGWVPGKSVTMLVSLICMPEFEADLECIELLAWSTDSVGDEFLRYAAEGSLSYLALLLAVARERLAAFILLLRDSLSNRTSSPMIAEDKKEDTALLLSVFETGGDELESYIKEDKAGVSFKKIGLTIESILRAKGFFLTHAVADFGSSCGLRLPYLKWYGRAKWATDDGMEHYGTSGRRWGQKGRGTRYYKQNKPSKYILYMDEKRQIPTAVGKCQPIPIPPFSSCDMSAAAYMKRYKIYERSAEETVCGSHAAAVVQDARVEDKSSGLWKKRMQGEVQEEGPSGKRPKLPGEEVCDPMSGVKCLQ